MSLTERGMLMAINTHTEAEVLKMIFADAEEEYRENERCAAEELGHLRNFQQLRRMMVRRACPNTPDTGIVLPQDHIHQLEEEMAIAQETWLQKRVAFNAAIDKLEHSPSMDSNPTLVWLNEKLACIKVETERRLAAIQAAR